MQRLFLLFCFASFVIVSPVLGFAVQDGGTKGPHAWQPLEVPGLWEDVGGPRFAKLDGFAWYRCWVKVPESWKGSDLSLAIDRVSNAFEAYWEGEFVGVGGGFTWGSVLLPRSVVLLKRA